MGYHEDTKIELKEAASRYQSSRSPYEIWVDGERKEVRPDELLVYLSKDRQHKYSAEWSNNKITVDTPAHRVQYNGRELSVETSSLSAFLIVVSVVITIKINVVT